MRERAFTTSVIWIALAVATGVILDSIRYTVLVPAPIPNDSTRLIEQTAFVSSWWQFGAGFLIFVLILAAMGATIAIWESAKKDDKAQLEAEKAKRDNRDARIKRLMATLDDDELDALEQRRIGDDGERLSVESLLRKRD